MDGSGSPCLKKGMEPVWAQFISDSITAYHNNGIPMWGLTIQNEPEFAAPWGKQILFLARVQDYFTNSFS